MYDKMGDMSVATLAVVIVMAIIVLFIATMILYYSWNKVLVKLINVFNPMTHYWQAFVVIVVAGIIFGSRGCGY